MDKNFMLLMSKFLFRLDAFLLNPSEYDKTRLREEIAVLLDDLAIRIKK